MDRSSTEPRGSGGRRANANVASAAADAIRRADANAGAAQRTDRREPDRRRAEQREQRVQQAPLAIVDERLQAHEPLVARIDLQAELHLKSDRLAIAYRRHLQRLGVTVGVA